MRFVREREREAKPRKCDGVPLMVGDSTHAKMHALFHAASSSSNSAYAAASAHSCLGALATSALACMSRSARTGVGGGWCPGNSSGMPTRCASSSSSGTGAASTESTGEALAKVHPATGRSLGLTEALQRQFAYDDEGQARNVSQPHPCLCP